MFDAQLFHVSAEVLVRKLELGITSLAGEPESRSSVFRARAGLDLQTLREAMVTTLAQLRVTEASERDAISRVVGTAVPGTPQLEPAQRWLGRVYAGADAYIARHGTDDLALAGRLRLGKQDASSADSLRRELTILVPEVASLRDRLRDYGYSDELVAQGWEAVEALCGQRPSSVDDIIALERANLALRKIEAQAAALLCILSAGEEVAYADAPRAPRKYGLADLGAARRKARVGLIASI
jgi:hypothetical protein